MKISNKSILMAVILISLVICPAFSQTSEEVQPQTAAAQIKEIAIYGEVQSVDPQASKLAVQYYDYDTDSEKIADININASTKIENAAALADIKKGDWVDVTYTVESDKNMARIVTVEIEELPATEERSPAAPSTPSE